VLGHPEESSSIAFKLSIIELFYLLMNLDSLDGVYIGAGT